MRQHQEEMTRGKKIWFGASLLFWVILATNNAIKEREKKKVSK